MITELDELQLHQTADTFDNTNVSDLRFFDRIWMGLQSPDGNLCLMTSLGVYKNNNVMDGYVCMQRDAKLQYNHRFSRQLRPNVGETRLGPMSITVLEPLKRVRIALEPGDYAGSCDIEWTAALPPHEEPRHRSVTNGRVVSDYLRFAQLGTASGWIEIEGERTHFENWYCSRDHSWGVRSGVGGFHPANEPKTEEMNWFAIFCWFLTEDVGGVLQMHEAPDGRRLMMDGHIEYRNAPGAPKLKVVDIQHDYELFPDTRLFKRGRLTAITEDGQKWEIEAENIGRAWLYRGSGYDFGYNDELGLGAWRGPWLEEYDTYDISAPEACVLPDGRVIRPWHREQLARVTVNGKPGQAHHPFFLCGENARYRPSRG